MKEGESGVVERVESECSISRGECEYLGAVEERGEAERVDGSRLLELLQELVALGSHLMKGKESREGAGDQNVSEMVVG